MNRTSLRELTPVLREAHGRQRCPSLDLVDFRERARRPNFRCPVHACRYEPLSILGVGKGGDIRFMCLKLLQQASSCAVPKREPSIDIAGR